jgi:ArsR family transcriptional regulator, arsenate/arsenite/antimonite-responsive transcriptional repressor
MDNTKEEAAVFAALGDPTRLSIFKLLCSQDIPGAICVNAIAMGLGISQPAISQHLRILKSAGLVSGERRGYHVHYIVNRDAVEKFKGLFSDTLKPQNQATKDICKNCDGKQITNK